ncbi:MAG: hypothetical protein JWO41_318 [Candidatus Saccharibacteria bacterium]|nr:hypothetical protein [Candidatus Saccharibacteria bacterium]
MLNVENLNYWAVLVAAVINMVVGSFWYSKQGFGKPWAAAAKVKLEDMMKDNAGAAYTMTTVAAVAQSFLLAVLVHNLAVTTVGKAVELGVLLWVGFVAACTISDTMFTGRSMRLWQINQGYYLLVLVANSVLLALWY